MSEAALQSLLDLLENSIDYADGAISLHDEDAVRQNIHKLATASALGKGETQSWARYLARLLALELGCPPASIQDLYMARGRGEVPPTFSVPAMNLRAMPFEAARAIFRNALAIDAGAFIFEIARSEIGYTEQRPSEYATNILCAAIAEGYRSPVFIQGDHFQVSAARYAQDPEAELQAVRDLCAEAIAAGFYNIDIDTSTLVDLSQEGEAAQQKNNSELSAMFTAYIRQIEPEGVTVSVGGEIGEVGGRNSNEVELRAYVDGYLKALKAQAPEAEGLSKISIQTGTSHGGTVLPDGSVAEVAVDFETLLNLSILARTEYGTAGAVQHGASTLPESAFGKFPEAEACEVHLATNFQNMLYDRLPKAMLDDVYAYLDENYGKNRKEGQTDEQFHYKERKRAIGAFKEQIWNLGGEPRQVIIDAWDKQFAQLFEKLAIADTRKYVEQIVSPVLVQPDMDDYFGAEAEGEEVGDLAD